jgi:hypothetical protein
MTEREESVKDYMHGGALRFFSLFSSSVHIRTNKRIPGTGYSTYIWANLDSAQIFISLNENETKCMPFTSSKTRVDLDKHTKILDIGNKLALEVKNSHFCSVKSLTWGGLIKSNQSTGCKMRTGRAKRLLPTLTKDRELGEGKLSDKVKRRFHALVSWCKRKKGI